MQFPNACVKRRRDQLFSVTALYLWMITFLWWDRTLDYGWEDNLLSQRMHASETIAWKAVHWMNCSRNTSTDFHDKKWIWRSYWWFFFSCQKICSTKLMFCFIRHWRKKNRNLNDEYDFYITRCCSPGETRQKSIMMLRWAPKRNIGHHINWVWIECQMCLCVCVYVWLFSSCGAMPFHHEHLCKFWLFYSCRNKLNQTKNEHTHSIQKKWFTTSDRHDILPINWYTWLKSENWNWQQSKGLLRNICRSARNSQILVKGDKSIINTVGRNYFQFSHLFGIFEVIFHLMSIINGQLHISGKRKKLNLFT